MSYPLANIKQWQQVPNIASTSLSFGFAKPKSCSSIGDMRMPMDNKVGGLCYWAKDICNSIALRTSTVVTVLDGKAVHESNVNIIDIHSGGRDLLTISESVLYSHRQISRMRILRKSITHYNHMELLKVPKTDTLTSFSEGITLIPAP